MTNETPNAADAAPIPENPPAFPRAGFAGNVQTDAGVKSVLEGSTQGMTLLDHFAGVALGSILASPVIRAGILEGCYRLGTDPVAHVAGFAYDHAEAMLAERARRLAS